MKTVIQMMCVVVIAFSSVASAKVNIETVPVGNPGNAADSTGYGAVAYEYNIGKYMVTVEQYAEFLNAVARTDTYGLYNPDMWSGPFAPIMLQQGGSPGSYTYSFADDRARRPVNHLNWGDAARFANWLHNGRPSGLQNDSTTEDGAYDMSATQRYYRPNGELPAMYSGDWQALNAALVGLSREPDWKWAIPTEDEWYKAAFHKNDGVTGNYFDYPTSSDLAPSNELIDPDPGNNATFWAHGYTVGSPYWCTEVGAHENSDSPYGTFDQGGNLYEWNEAIVDGSRRGMRGGVFGLYASDLHVNGRNYRYPIEEEFLYGLRVSEAPQAAMAPEADADGPYTIWVGDPLILNANHSTDPDGEIISYLWDLDNDGVFETDAGDQRFFEVDCDYVQGLGLAVGGMYDIHLRVTDNTGLTDTDSSSLRVVPEPATLSLLALGGLAVIRRRKK